ncbi:MAG TPA: hypothetical protein VL241_10615 [Gemmatimonadales bacterium]|nr:hypothetical protein [Gemmatimonadales bacterium]
MTRLAAVALALTLLPAIPATAQRSRVVVVVPGQLTRVVVDTMGTPYPVPFPRAQAYRALLAIFAELKLPTDGKDSAATQVDTQLFYRQGSVAGKQISSYLSCGDGITGPNADSYRVYMNITSTIAAAPDNKSILKTVFLAGAVNVTEGSRQPMPCESTGRLEVRIHQLVLHHLITAQ